eukprot:TRINITY_DN5255_c0_g5_i1.p1 TRINITY_DN5255_c0_g5~~TRINITY_DN5255_c0_g5_i1.p1  ORF type:complete len:473 (+),score=66.73 TRINITY_DN5255_c0_g5_i1:35-1420(+)
MTFRHSLQVTTLVISAFLFSSHAQDLFCDINSNYLSYDSSSSTCVSASGLSIYVNVTEAFVDVRPTSPPRCAIEVRDDFNSTTVRLSCQPGFNTSVFGSTSASLSASCNLSNTVGTGVATPWAGSDIAGFGSLITCTPIGNITNTSVCPYTCTGMCASISGDVLVGETVKCAGTAMPATPLNAVCTTGGTPLNVSCAGEGDSDEFTTLAAFRAWAVEQPGYCIPERCQTLTCPVTCPSINVNSPLCSACFDCDFRAADSDDSAAERDTFEVASDVDASRQSRRRLGVACPAAAASRSALYDCFEQAACSDLISPADMCFYGSISEPCPKCPGGASSKKGLYGLLGLLGIIPIACSSLLLLLALCCIRRSKTDDPRHIVTFDPQRGDMTDPSAAVPSYVSACPDPVTAGMLCGPGMYPNCAPLPPATAFRPGVPGRAINGPSFVPAGQLGQLTPSVSQPMFL